MQGKPAAADQRISAKGTVVTVDSSATSAVRRGVALECSTRLLAVPLDLLGARRFRERTAKPLAIFLVVHAGGSILRPVEVARLAYVRPEANLGFFMVSADFFRTRRLRERAAQPLPRTLVEPTALVAGRTLLFVSDRHRDLLPDPDLEATFVRALIG